MNNNRGWGLRNELWICFGMILFFAIAVILINKVFANMDNNSFVKNDDKDIEEVIPKKDNISSEVTNNKSEIIDDNKNEEVNTINYSNLEDKLVVAGSKYANKYLSNENISNTKVITVVRLQTEDLLKSLNINETKCSGYIKIEHNDESFKYYPYIKCGSLYQTAGYDENLDNTDL